MSARRKELLIVLIVAMSFSGGIYFNKQLSNQATIQIEQVDNSISDEELKYLSEGWARLNKETDSMIAEADVVIEDLKRSSQPAKQEIKKSYHDGGYERSLVQDIDPEKGLVLVTTIDSKISIIFKPAPENLDKFHVGWWPPVTFQCTKKMKGKCDFNFPYKLFVNNGLVEVKQIKFP